MNKTEYVIENKVDLISTKSQKKLFSKLYFEQNEFFLEAAILAIFSTSSNETLWQFSRIIIELKRCWSLNGMMFQCRFAGLTGVSAYHTQLWCCHSQALNSDWVRVFCLHYLTKMIRHSKHTTMLYASPKQKQSATLYMHVRKIEKKKSFLYHKPVLYQTNDTTCTFYTKRCCWLKKEKTDRETISKSCWFKDSVWCLVITTLLHWVPWFLHYHEQTQCGLFVV